MEKSVPVMGSAVMKPLAFVISPGLGQTAVLMILSGILVTRKMKDPRVIRFSYEHTVLWCQVQIKQMSKNEGSIQVNKALSEETQFKELLLSLLDFGYAIFAVAVQELNKEEHKP